MCVVEDTAATAPVSTAMDILHNCQTNVRKFATPLVSRRRCVDAILLAC